MVTLLLSGCVGVPGNPEKMSPEQLREWAKDKNANVACAVVNSPYGRGVATYLVLDKGLVVNGQLSIDGECKVMIQNSPPPFPPPQPVPIPNTPPNAKP